MPTYLVLDCQLRTETDAQTIANLERKGWVETVPPSYDPATQQPPVWENCGWVVKPIPPPQPYRVSKDTITSRVLDAGKIPDLMAVIDGLNAEEQFLWTNYAWFWNNNPTALAICAQLGLDPAVILAPDPYLT
jgi:hypothetical protein